MRWIPFPFIRIIIFFLSGILAGIYCPDVIPYTLAVTILLFLVVLYFLVFIIRPNFKKTTGGFIGFLAVFMCGFAHLVNQTDSRKQDHILNFKNTIESYAAEISNAPEEKEHSWKAEARVKAVKIKGRWEKGRGKVLFYFSKSDFKIPYQYGDVVLVKGYPQIVKSPQNPGEFDYKRFLQLKNIYHQQYVRKEDILFVKHEPGTTLFRWSLTARTWADSRLKKFVQGEREQAITSALVLGIKDDLDDDLLNAYASSGALHILSVSGLHVGIVYFIILLLFKPITKFKGGKWLLALLCIIVLWAYAFVTGLSPSALRAVTMFSFVALSTPQNKRTNIYNTLAISAFCLLLYDPFMIMSVGFQLSYLAVIGIVYLQPSFYRLWEPNSRFLDEVWKITSVSIAAQVATFSLGLLYFHQFPNYFLFSNLFVIPGSFVVLVSGIALLVFSFVKPVAMMIGFLLEWVIKIMNALVLAIESLPFSRLENIFISSFQCSLILGMVAALVLTIKYKRFGYVIVVASILVLFSIAQWLYFEKEFNVKKIIVYGIPNHSAIDLFDRGQAYFITDSVLYADSKRIKFHISTNRLMSGISRVKRVNMELTRSFLGCKVILWKGYYILQITDKNFSIPPLPVVDYVLIGNNGGGSLVTIKQQLNFKKLIIDSSNSFYFADNLLKQAKELKIDVHSVLHQGAYVHTL